ncbi:MAG: hypothetical protein RL308_1168 [Bacteroidota bacterium]|jgi:hypothetical protein
MKKIIFILFAVVSWQYSNAQNFNVGGIYYNVTSPTTVEVGLQGQGVIGTKTIPAQVTYNSSIYSVTSIGDYAFMNSNNLTAVIMPNSITSIGYRSFSNCNNVASFTIPNAVTKIGQEAFYSCSSLTSLRCDVITPLSINQNVFGNLNQGACTLKVPAGSIAAYQAAEVWKNFAAITCSNPTINTTTVSACVSYTWANTGQMYTTTGVYTGLTANCVTEELNLTITTAPTSFNVEGLNYVVTSATTVAVGVNAGKSGSIVIPASVTTACGTYAVTRISASAFQACSGLTSIAIPSSVTSIGNQAFIGCTSLSSVIIPNSVTNVGAGAFRDCTGLTSVTISNALTSTSQSTFYNCTNLESINIPSSLTSIGPFTFYGCSGLQSVIIPSSVTSIGNSAFDSCSSLTSITIPGSVTSISPFTFYRCSALQSVTIPNSVTSISNSAFDSCSSLTSITIPSSVSSIGDFAFYNCYNLTSVLCDIEIPLSINSNVFGFVNQGNCSLSVPNASVAAYQTAAVWKNFIPISCVIRLGTTFSSGGINYVVTSPTNVAVSINTGTTGNNVVIPTTVTKGCETYSVTSIVDGAFAGCSGLTSVSIPNSVTSIGVEAFAYCSGLTTVNIPNSLTNIEDGTFEGCSGLQSCSIPNSVITISSSAFGFCTGLTTLTIPNSVTGIGPGAFGFCSGLTEVTIPNSMTILAYGAFYNCSSLRSIVCNLETPLSITADPSNPYAVAYGVFGGSVNQAACTLAVPAASIDAYKAAPIWQNFAPITSISTTYTTAWDYGVPTNIVNAVIAGDYTTTTGSFTAKSLTVNAGKTLTVATGTSLTVVGALVNNGSIIVENNANLIQTSLTNTNSGSGTATVVRNSNALKRLDFTMWSSPVTGTQTLLNFSPLTSAAPVRFYTYNPIANRFTTLEPSTTTFTAGSGYLIRMPNEKPGSIGLTTPYYLGVETLSYPGVFTGTLNNGPITLNTVANKFYSIGNPFPSTISADDFLKGNETAGTLYFWRKTNGALGTAYSTYNVVLGGVAGSGGITPNGTIQVGQGFIVKPTTTALTFTNAMREVAPTNTQFLKTKKVTDKSRLWLDLSDATSRLNQVLIGYLDGATVGFDSGIDGKYFNDSNIALTSIVEGEEYVIQGRPAFDATDVVALGFKTDVAGTYRIALNSFDGVFEKGQDIYLVDAIAGKEIDLKTGSYTFTTASGQDNSRFSLKYQKTLNVDTPTFDENSVKVYKNKGTIFINATSKTIKTIEIYDVQGRLIAKQMNVNDTKTSITNLKEVRQMLIVKVHADDNSVVSKKVMN